MAVCKFCGAPVEVGYLCEYCGQRAEYSYYPDFKKPKDEGAREKKAPIPVGGYYSVERGDTLWHIAKRAYNDPMQYRRIAEANKLKNPNLIILGQKLYIP